MRDHGKDLPDLQSVPEQALSTDLDISSEFSRLSMKTKDIAESRPDSTASTASGFISERGSTFSTGRFQPCIEEEIVSDLNNMDKTMIDMGNRAQLRRKNSSVSRKRRRHVSDPVISVMPKPVIVARSLSLNKQPTYVGRSETFWEDGVKNTDLCSTEL